MNEQRVHRHSHGLISDSTFELGGYSSQQLPWNMGVSQLQTPWPENSPSSIMSRFDSPGELFYATERCIGLPSHYESHVGSSSPSLPEFRSSQAFAGNYSMDTSEDIRNTLQSIVQSQTGSSPSYESFERHNQIPESNLRGNELFVHQHMNQDGVTDPVRRPFSLSIIQNQEQQAKQSTRTSLGASSATNGESSLTTPSLSGKTRIQWTLDLHEKFVECINTLGGADKATPKAILKMMGLDGLTISHVKSHLQKYRFAKHMPDSAVGKSEKRTSVNLEPQIDVKTGLQIRDALQLQLDVQKQLHEQLESQRKLQLRIEKQGEQLMKMFDLQQKQSDKISKTPKLYLTCNEDGPSNNEIQVSSAEGSENSLFPSKISLAENRAMSYPWTDLASGLLGLKPQCFCLKTPTDF